MGNGARSGWAAGLGALLLLLALASPTVAAGGRDYDVANGHYYEQGSPSAGRGFTVHDDEVAPLWREFQRLGGVPVLGYPVSRRYACDGAQCQVFQQAVFKWSPGAAEVELLKVLDWLRLNGRGAWIEERWSVPPPAGMVFVEAGLVPADALEPVVAPKPTDATPPTFIAVSELGVQAPVIVMDMGADAFLPVPDNGRVVAWYSYGARLGEGGNAVYAGHVDWNGQRGAFWRLHEAQPGQLITVRSSAGWAYDYRVEWARSFPESSPAGLDALGPVSGTPTITLVTCGGRFDVRTRSYDDRHIVRAILVAQRRVEGAS